jgi:hypothetical protein
MLWIPDGTPAARCTERSDETIAPAALDLLSFNDRVPKSVS